MRAVTGVSAYRRARSRGIAADYSPTKRPANVTIAEKNKNKKPTAVNTGMGPNTVAGRANAVSGPCSTMRAAMRRVCVL